MKIKDLKVGDRVNDMDVYVSDNSGLTYKDKRSGNEKSVLKYVFADETGEISYVDWNKKPEEAQLEKNQVVKMSCYITEYKDIKQISDLRIKASDLPIAMFTKKSKFDIEEMWGRYVSLVDKMENPVIKAKCPNAELKGLFGFHAFKNYRVVRDGGHRRVNSEKAELSIIVDGNVIASDNWMVHLPDRLDARRLETPTRLRGKVKVDVTNLLMKFLQYLEFDRSELSELMANPECAELYEAAGQKICFAL